MSNPTPSSGTVLLVDDDPVIREVATQLLTSAGWEVLTAEDGTKALDLHAAHAARIRVAILDVLMPGMDGAALFRCLRLRQPGLAVVVATGYSADVDLNHLHEQGAVVITKPYRREGLLRAIAVAIERTAALTGGDPAPDSRSPR
jgi:CheY-like chemotaxis protein